MFSRLANSMKDEKDREALPVHHRNLNLDPLPEDRVCHNRFSLIKCDEYVEEGEDYCSWCQEHDPEDYPEPDE